MSLTISFLVTAVVVFFQFKFFFKTRKYKVLFSEFFKKKGSYTTTVIEANEEIYPQLAEVGMPQSDLNSLIQEINNYVVKTKGSVDFSHVQNRVERKLNMRYDQSSTNLSFPTYLGLMGTFLGVFIGILMFNMGFTDGGDITDESIKSLLVGVLVSMATSLFGLILTTINTAALGAARQKIEEDKNEFYDYLQTELIPNLNTSLVAAIGKLHTTVDKFEPSFNRVIERFQTTFDTCTAAFGKNFEQNVVAVANAVTAMGQNMDKINENIRLQKDLITTLKSDQVAKGMERYVEASNHFVSITQSLNKFEEARRMMLAAAQEAINVQNAYNDSLKIPQEVALGINRILDRIKNFEKSVNQVGAMIDKTQILSNSEIEKIKDQINSIAKKNKVADRYVEMADEKLERLFEEQTRAISLLSQRYKQAISEHIDSFGTMLEEQTKELEKRHELFMQAIEERLSIEDVRTEFTHLRKLEEIEKKTSSIDKKVGDVLSSSIDSNTIQRSVSSALAPLQEEVSTIKTDLKKIEAEKSGGVFGGIFGSRNNK